MNINDWNNITKSLTRQKGAPSFWELRSIVFTFFLRNPHFLLAG